jgi:aryl-alcohol dehydrogenase-like predicted oxidoreductase
LILDRAILTAVKYLEVGGVRISRIGLGTWQFGAREWGYGSDYADRDAISIVHRALDLGINLIDTAESYAFGRSESIIGKAIAGRRDDAFLATKVFPVMPLAPIVVQRGRASARRLGVDVIDLYQVHWPNPLVPLVTTMEGMRRLQDDGVVAHVGVSNFNLKKWQEAERHLGGPVLSNQVQYSLAHRSPEKHLVPWAHANGRVVIAYSPLAQGFLSARYDASNSPGGVRAVNSNFLPENLARAAPLFQALREVAKVHDVKPAQVALAWLVRRPNVVAIPGASSVAQLEANAVAADLELSDQEDAQLTEASDAFRPETGLGTIPRRLTALARR